MTEDEFKTKTGRICVLYKRCSDGCPLREPNICTKYWKRTEEELYFIANAYYYLFGGQEPKSVNKISISADDVMCVLSAE